MKRLLYIALMLAFAMLAEPATPTISWVHPGDMRSPTALGATQLNASADVPGTFVYTPPAGTVLPVGNDQTLSVTFTPTDTEAYTTATATVQINVIPTYWPYDPTETAYVCHVNPDLTPIIDLSVGLPRCFVVPVAVSVAITKWMLTQTEGLNVDGTVRYKYATWWDFIVKNFIDTVVLPTLEQFPPPEVEQAKQNAKAAAKAVDAAKASILGLPPAN